MFHYCYLTDNGCIKFIKNYSIRLQTFNEVQKLLSKTNGKLVGDLMTPAPVVVRETTNLEDAARYGLLVPSSTIHRVVISLDAAI